MPPGSSHWRGVHRPSSRQNVFASQLISSFGSHGGRQRRVPHGGLGTVSRKYVRQTSPFAQSDVVAQLVYGQGPKTGSRARAADVSQRSPAPQSRSV
jgi:hypothetical protein